MVFSLGDVSQQCKHLVIRSQVLQIPVLKAKDVKKLAQGVGLKVPLLGQSSVPTVDNTLEEYLQQAGSLFGLDPGKWEQVGAPTTEVTEADGKRIIKKTGVYSGTELHLWVLNPHYDVRLPSRPDCPELDFTIERKEVTSTAEWQQVLNTEQHKQVGQFHEDFEMPIAFCCKGFRTCISIRCNVYLVSSLDVMK